MDDFILGYYFTCYENPYDYCSFTEFIRRKEEDREKGKLSWNELTISNIFLTIKFSCMLPAISNSYRDLIFAAIANLDVEYRNVHSTCKVKLLFHHWFIDQLASRVVKDAINNQTFYVKDISENWNSIQLGGLNEEYVLNGIKYNVFFSGNEDDTVIILQVSIFISFSIKSEIR